MVCVCVCVCECVYLIEIYSEEKHATQSQTYAEGQLFRAAKRLGSSYLLPWKACKCRTTCNVWSRKQLLPVLVGMNSKTNVFLGMCC